MSLDKFGIDNTIIDSLYKKYGVLDDEGFLIGTNHENFLAMQKRIDDLNRKKNLTPEEEREGAELIIVHKAYMKELTNYVMNDGEVLDESEDLDFEPDDDSDDNSDDDESDYDESDYDDSDNS